MPPFVRAKELAENTGPTARYFAALACQNQVPGAHQPTGSGGAWLFDAQKFWEWFRTSERNPVRLSTIGAASEFGGPRFTSDSDRRLRERLGLDKEPGQSWRRQR